MIDFDALEEQTRAEIGIEQEPLLAMLEESIPTVGHPAANILATHIETVRAFVDERPLSIVAHSQVKNELLSSEEPTSIVGQVVNEGTQDQMATLANVLGKKEFAELTEFAPQAIQDMADAALMPDALQRQYINAIKGSDDKFEQIAISQQFLYAEIAKVFSTEEFDFLDKAGNFAAAIFPLEGIKDSLEFLGIGEGTAEQLRNWFLGLDPEQQILMTPIILEELNRAFDGNPYKGESKARVLLGGRLRGNIGRFSTAGLVETLSVVAVDLAPIIYPIVRGIQTANAVRMASKLDNPVLSAEMNAQAATSEAVAEAASIDKFTTQVNMSGVGDADIYPAMATAADGSKASILSEETVLAAERIQGRRGVFNDKLGAIELKSESVLSPEERAEAITNLLQDDDWFKRIADAELRENINTYIEPVFKGETLDGILVQTKTIAGDTVEVLIRHNKNDIGEFAEETIGAGSAIFSPDVWLRKGKDGIAKIAATQGMRYQSAIVEMSGILKTVRKGIKGKRGKQLDEVLMTGNDRAQTYNIHQLMEEGIETPVGRVFLDEKQVEGYFKSRDAFDWFKVQINNRERERLVFEGFKGVSLVEGPGVRLSTEIGVGKPINKGKIDAERIFDSETGLMVNITGRSTAEKLASEEYVVMRLNNNAKITAKGAEETAEEFNLVLMKKTDITELPNQVTRSITGYVPILREGVNYVLKRKIKVVVNGKEVEKEITEGLFSTADDAAVYQKSFIKRNEDLVDEDFVIRNDREVDPINPDVMMIGRPLGKSSRSSREIYEGKNIRRANTTEALHRQMDQVVRAGTMNQFRFTATTKFENTWGKWLSDPSDWQSSVLKGTPEDITKAIEKTREYIQRQIGVPTRSERKFSALTNRMGRAVEGSKLPGADKLRRVLMDTTVKDPFSAARTVTYNAMLGTFNYAQLVVQASGATIALAANPIHGAKAIGNFFVLRSMSSSKAMQSGFGLKRMASAAGLPEEEMTALFKAYKETGIFDSFKSQADYSAALKSGKVDAGVMQKFFDSGLWFVKEGENFNRTVGFLSAFEKFKAANKGKKITQYSALDWKTINEDGIGRSLNMHASNAAAWQRGLPGLALQFKSVQAKYLESVLGLNGTFTRTERLRLVLGQMALFGAAGLPSLPGLDNNELVGQMVAGFGVDFSTLSSTERAAWSDGLSGAMFELAFDEPFSISNRVAIQAGFEEAWQMWGDDSTLADAFFGAFGSVAHRGWQASKIVAGALTTETLTQFPEEVALLAINEFAKIASSWNNLQKGRLWENLGHAVDSKGRPLFPVKKGDKVILLQKLGFTPSQIISKFKGDQFIRAKNEEVQNVTTQLRLAQNQYFADSERDRNDPKKLAKIHQFYMSRKATLLLSLPLSSRAAVNKTLNKEALNPKLGFDKTRKALIDSFINDGDKTNLLVGEALATKNNKE